MRDNPVHTFLQLLTGQIGDQVAIGGVLQWYTVALYWALLIGGIAIAIVNWRRDPAQRTFHHFSVFAMRFIVAGCWYLGSFWKLPWPVSSGFRFWMESTVKFSAFQWHADMMQAFLDHIAIVQPLIYLLEVGFAVSLMLGFMVRLSGIVVGLFTLNLMIGLYNAPTEWPWTYVGLIFTHWMFAATQAGRSLGLDNLIAKRLVSVPALNGGRDTVAARAFRWAS